MSSYRVISGKCELPRDSRFTVLSGPVPIGALALFEVNGNLTIGRWFPNVAGYNWIVEPTRLICDTGTAPVRIIGRVMPIEIEIKQITNLPDHERVFEHPLLRRCRD